MAVDDMLHAHGFRSIGHLENELDLSVWWNQALKIQGLLVRTGPVTLLKATKTYAMVSRSGEDEFWARDIGAFHDYLEAHFRELHLTASFFRDVPAWLARRHASVSRLPGVRDGEESLAAAVQGRLDETTASLASVRRARGLLAPDSQVLADHLRGQESRLSQESAQLRALRSQALSEATMFRQVQREYQAKGSALCVLVTIASNLQLVREERLLTEALESVVNELTSAHRHQVTQLFTGGRLRIKLDEVETPALAWLEQWFGGALHPSQVEFLCGSGARAGEALCGHTFVTPDQDIIGGASVVERKKLAPPRVVASFLSRVGTPARAQAGSLPEGGPVLGLGRSVTPDGELGPAWTVPLRHLGHVMVSGSTGSGKSVAVRILVEEIAGHTEVSVLVLDPRNQSAGLLAPQDRPEFLERYPLFEMDRPRGFDFRYFAPGSPGLPGLPSNASDLCRGRTVVSLKALGDADRCRTLASILDGAFAWASREEVDRVRLVVVVDEAQLFTRRLAGAAPDAKAAASAAEMALDRILREGRKYGIAAVVSSQSMMDFVRDAAAIRQNATTKVFFRNSDREIGYTRDYLDDARELVRLMPGIALVSNPSLGVMRACFRPPLSAVWDFSEMQTGALLGRHGHKTPEVSAAAARLLSAVSEHAERNGAAPNMSELGRLVGITSKRRLQDLVRELSRPGSSPPRAPPRRASRGSSR